MYKEPSEEAKNARAEYIAKHNLKPRILGERKISKEEARTRRPMKEHESPHWNKKD